MCVPALVFGDIGDELRYAVLQDPASDAAIGRETHGGEALFDLRCNISSVREVQLLPFLVEQQDRTALRVQQFLGARHHAADELIQVDQLAEGAAYLVEE